MAHVVQLLLTAGLLLGLGTLGCSGEAPVEAGPEEGADSGGGGGDDGGDGGGGDDPTWHADIAPIVAANCVVCHDPDGMQPDLLFDEPETASAMAGLIDHAVQEARMPPFYAVETEECENPWGFAVDPRLDEADKALIAAWAAAGGPVGDPETAAPLPEVPSSDLEDADLLAGPAGVHTTSITGEVEDEFICFSIDIGADEERWLEAYQVVPDDLGVVHHVLLGIDEDGESAALVDDEGRYDCFGSFGVNATFIGGWVPGSSPVVFPDHSAVRVPVDARVVLQIHYHLVDEAREDGTGVALRWADETPVQEARIGLIGNAGVQTEDGDGLQPGPDDPDDEPVFSIPAGASEHTETMRYHPWNYAPRSSYTFLVGNHMHYIGSDMRVWIEPEDQPEDEQCLLHTPTWDFDWQQFYFYDPSVAAPVANVGDALWLECVYDNSLSNPDVVQALAEAGLDEPVDVTLGEGSLDEMCIVILGEIYDVPVSVDGATHTGTLELSVSSDHHGFGSIPCKGPVGARSSDDGVDAVGACGLDVAGNLYTVEFEMSAAGDEGDASVVVLGVDDTVSLSWSGDLDSGYTLSGSGVMAGGEILFEGTLELEE